jgi:hypothetical protein
MFEDDPQPGKVAEQGQQGGLDEAPFAIEDIDCSAAVASPCTSRGIPASSMAARTG